MDTFALSATGLPSDESINGYYGASVMPSSAQAAPGADVQHGAPMALPGVANVSSILIWWFILLGLCVAFHVITLRAPGGG